MNLTRIAITGPECSGKSALTEALSAHFGAPMAREYAREYLHHSKGIYNEASLLEMARGQIALEDEAVHASDRIVFFDTDMLVYKIWSLFRFGTVAPFIDQASSRRIYHLRLLCKPDLPWVPDPFRESPDQEERELLFKLYERQLQAMGASYAIIEGTGPDRLYNAVHILERHFALV